MSEERHPCLCLMLWVLSLAGIMPGGCTVTRHTPPNASAIESLPTVDHGAVIRGNPAHKRIALVFTGGEHGGDTGAILDALTHADIRAGFFVTGQYLANPEHHRHLIRMVAEGHYLGPHSDGHLLYCAWEDRARTLVTEQAFKTDLRKNIDDVRHFGALRGDQPIYFIPPYEWFNEDQVRWADDMGVVLFNFTPGSGSNRDWIPEGTSGFRPSSVILRDILRYERESPTGLNGSILLLHLGSLRQDKMHPHVPQLIAELRRRGYEFVRIDEILAPNSERPPSP